MTRLFVNSITNIDFSYLHPERGLLGETLICDLCISGELDADGMILDFGTLKKDFKGYIEDLVDHKLLIPAQSKHLKYQHLGDQNLHLCWSLNSAPANAANLIEHTSPAQAVELIPCEGIDIQSLNHYLVERLQEKTPQHIHQVAVALRCEEIVGPYYHYSHGLKNHAGDCQRIAHGHRSKIQIYEDGKYSAEHSQYWANAFKDIYIGQWEDLVNDPQPHELAHFRYTSNQGAFELKLPKHQVYMIHQSTTVEHICAHIRDRLHLSHPLNSFEVYAYEGFGKGAICETTE